MFYIELKIIRYVKEKGKKRIDLLREKIVNRIRFRNG